MHIRILVAMPYAEPEHRPVPLLASVDQAEVTGPMKPARQDIAYIACQGGGWRRFRVIAWGKLPASADDWAVMLRWRADDLGWYRYDPAMMHPADRES
jgi:hypothetical protein